MQPQALLGGRQVVRRSVHHHVFTSAVAVHRERLEREVREVSEEVVTAEEQLVSLRKENRRTMWVSVLIFSVLAALYYLISYS